MGTKSGVFTQRIAAYLMNIDNGNGGHIDLLKRTQIFHNSQELPTHC